jgi:hemerythrin-like domain-containing protein
MLSEASQRLADDHQELENLARELETVLEANDAQAVYSTLDLFWARLAVHIRTEHLLLFPLVLNALEKSEPEVEDLPPIEEAQRTVARLRSDHDFFMRELARAIAVLREVRTPSDSQDISAGLRGVEKSFAAVRQRLAEHNEVEELKVYRWVALLLNTKEIEKLASQISVELGKRPPRFAAAGWSE